MRLNEAAKADPLESLERDSVTVAEAMSVAAKLEAPQRAAELLNTLQFGHSGAAEAAPGPLAASQPPRNTTGPAGAELLTKVPLAKATEVQLGSAEKKPPVPDTALVVGNEGGGIRVGQVG
jgi:hypothetical protein